jgi:aryl-alcohol dehydrogenase-like predicted oxidoreductase
MKSESTLRVGRRRFLQGTLGAGASLLAFPHLSLGAARIDKAVTRVLGRTGLEVTTLGLGGQGSLQWTPGEEKPIEIIAKAVNKGVTYLDTSNVYGASQMNYGQAFRDLGLAPRRSNYEEKKRRGMVIASKTMIRYARGGKEGIKANTEGPEGSLVVDDLKRSLSQLFGDGKGGYPDGAYLDIYQIHNLTSMKYVDAIYEGLDDPGAERIGAFVALLDYRDGTNLTGLNPKEEKLIRHIGITGHKSSPVLMACIQRDDKGIIDTVLTTTNANDRLYLNHQYNVLPVAAAKNLGVIGMKVFADGAMYSKGAHWSEVPEDVVRTVGSPTLPSAPLIRYSLSLPGVTTNIIGIGHVDTDDDRCQLARNFGDSQMESPIDESGRREIEQLARRAKDGKTNYFQQKAQPLSPPQKPAVTQELRGDTRFANLTWHTAFAGEEPISHYEIERDGKALGRAEHKPQTSTAPFAFVVASAGRTGHRYRVVTVDASGRRAASQELELAAL